MEIKTISIKYFQKIFIHTKCLSFFEVKHTRLKLIVKFENLMHYIITPYLIAQKDTTQPLEIVQGTVFEKLKKSFGQRIFYVSH